MGARLTFNHFLLFCLLYLTIWHEIYQTAEQNKKVPNTNIHVGEHARTHTHTHTAWLRKSNYNFYSVKSVHVEKKKRKYESLYSVMESPCIP